MEKKLSKSEMIKWFFNIARECKIKCVSQKTNSLRTLFFI